MPRLSHPNQRFNKQFFVLWVTLGRLFRGKPAGHLPMCCDGDYAACKEAMPPMLDFVKRSGIPLYK